MAASLTPRHEHPPGRQPVAMPRWTSWRAWTAASAPSAAEPPSSVDEAPVTKLLAHDSAKPSSAPAAPPLDESVGWHLLRSGLMSVGGLHFVAGSALCFPAYTELNGTLVALSFLLGSVYFCGADALQLVSDYARARPPSAVRTEWLSLCGNGAYALGSAAFLPALAEAAPPLGYLGFVLGSAMIAVSTLLRLARVARSPRAAGGVLADADSRSAACVELGVCVGAVCFLASTGALWHAAPAEGSAQLLAVHVAWLLGSAGFLSGGLALAHRHFVLRLC